MKFGFSFILGAVSACILGNSQAFAEPTVLPEALLESQCENGEGAACLNNGRNLVALGGEERIAQARQMFARGCEFGEETACEFLVPMLLGGQGGAQDLESAERVADGLCKGGLAQGCSWQGNAIALRIASSAGNESEYNKVRILYLRSCEAELAEACGQAGAMMATGLGGDVDVEQGARLLKKACDGKIGQACANLGTMLRDGIGLEPSPIKALENFALGCDLGVAFACNEAGVLWMQHADATGQESWRISALRAFKSACTGNDASGCNNAARQLHMGHGVARDPAAAFDLARRGCDLGHAKACYRAGTMRRDGNGVALDLLKWMEFADRACQLGHMQACNASLDEVVAAGGQSE